MKFPNVKYIPIKPDEYLFGLILIINWPLIIISLPFVRKQVTSLIPSAGCKGT